MKEADVGDRTVSDNKVLVRNKREQGGPGKIRSHWEQDIYQVLEKKKDEW